MILTSEDIEKFMSIGRGLTASPILEITPSIVEIYERGNDFSFGRPSHYIEGQGHHESPVLTYIEGQGHHESPVLTLFVTNSGKEVHRERDTHHKVPLDSHTI